MCLSRGWTGIFVAQSDNCSPPRPRHTTLSIVKENEYEKKKFAMSEAFTTTRLVEFRDTDAAGIVHFATFFDWMEEVEHEFLRQLGLSVMMTDDNIRISFPRVHASCDYQSSLQFEDVVDIEMTVQQLGT